MDDVYLYTVDDLSAVVQNAGEKRQAAVAQAEAIIETGVQSFVHWMDQRATVPLIQALQVQTDAWRELELARARKQLAKGADIEQVLDALTRGLTQKTAPRHAWPSCTAPMPGTAKRWPARWRASSCAATPACPARAAGHPEQRHRLRQPL